MNDLLNKLKEIWYSLSAIKKAVALGSLAILLFILIKLIPSGPDKPPKPQRADYGIESHTGKAVISPNQIVVRYKTLKNPGPARDSLRARVQNDNSFSITNVATCNCNLTDIELWTIDTTGFAAQGNGGIEDVLRNLQNNEGEGDMEGEHQYYFNVQTNATTCNDNNVSLASRVGPQTGERVINVAIIDTGIDYQYFSPILYNSKSPSNCDDNISGWDFVNDDNDPFDDHYHGTVVANILSNGFDSMEVPYRILPLKAFDENGRGSYFDVICAIRYIHEQGDINIVNMSFGWDEIDDYHIMKDLIDQTKQTLFVASAGNSGKDTDQPGNEHYPSGFNSNNLLAVAGYSPPEGDNAVLPSYSGSGTYSGIVIDPHSNYGQQSIDMAAPFIHYIEMSRCNEEGLTEVVNARVGGTSYSVPYVIGRAGYHLWNDINKNPAALKLETDRSGFAAPDFGSKLKRNIAISNQLNQSNPSNQQQ